MEGIFNPSCKKVTKDIVYSPVKELKDGYCDLAFTINGEDLIDKDIDEGLKIMDANGLIKNGNMIIPAGLTLSGTTDFGGAIEYNFNDGFIKVDLAFDSDEEENEYIS